MDTLRNLPTDAPANLASLIDIREGRVVSVMGLLGAAISSVGLGGLGLKLRKRSRKQK